MSDLLFIRHAETDMAGTFSGQSDPPVNAAGIHRIRTLVERLRAEPIAAVFSSDLDRAMTTARALADFFAVPCLPRPNLREIAFGEWEGRTWAQIEAHDPIFARRWIDNFPRLTPPQGEYFETFKSKVIAEMSYFLSRPEPGLVAIVTHAGVMRVVLQSFCGLDEQTAIVLRSSNPNLQLRVTQDPSTPVAVHTGSPFFEVAQYAGRWFLRDGYHRAYNLLRSGVFQLPAVIVRARTIGELGAVQPRFFSENTLLSQHPPFVSDFLDDHLTIQYDRPPTIKTLRITMDESVVYPQPVRISGEQP
jgi:broad specificity phosphatase PhoE